MIELKNDRNDRNDRNDKTLINDTLKTDVTFYNITI